ARVLIRPGHRVAYDVVSDDAIRSVSVGGVLAFARDRDTRLTVGLLRVQPGEDTTESGFDCTLRGHVPTAPQGAATSEMPAIEVGTPNDPIPANHNATIRLAALPGMDPQSFPALVCCGGRLDLHGAPMSRTWVKLGAAVAAGDREVTLREPVTGWRAGDRVILTATTRQMKRAKTFRPSTADSTQTEERVVTAVSPDGTRLTLDKPLAFAHVADGEYRGDVANLSRNVVVESADPDKGRGHAMYHRDSAGAVSYAEFRHLGKEGVLGRYALHFHLCGDTMRGASVVGASFWDSHNRWLTIHGTNYLVVRDCVGYKSKGHGFFMEDGTEQFNVLDRNLAVQAYMAKKLPEQLLPYDENDGAGFWWANNRNALTRNVAAECDEYGYFFQAIESPAFKLAMNVRQPDGTKGVVDIRTLPFVRFADNEAHCQRRHGFNFGGSVPFGTGVNGVGPDAAHPFVISNFRVWNSHWSFHPVAPSLLVDGLDAHDCEYGVWRPAYKDHAYRGVRLDKISVSTEFTPTGRRTPEAQYPGALRATDDLPPATVVTRVAPADGAGGIVVRGTTSDNGEVRRVTVNGVPARSTRGNFDEWELTLSDAAAGPRLTALAEDAAGNVEKTPHVVTRAR
ncbi:MAG: G8 domain-containing protein, partial [Phycisphaerae bacterium]